MIITKIEQQKKCKDRKTVFLDDKFGFGIDDIDLYKLKLKVGANISSEELAKIKETVLFSSAKNYVLRLTTHSAYTRHTLKNKLLQREYDEAVAEKALDFAEYYKLIDDYDYARRFINDALKLRGKGISLIKYELKQKGISDSIISDVTESIAYGSIEEESILPLARKKISGNFEYNNIMKTKRYLAAKGYSFELIDKTINIIKEEAVPCNN